jgi:alpha-glucosidase (family GH31 glycosyl hydrolase)
MYVEYDVVIIVKGGTVMRALGFEFFDEPNIDDIDTQFMVGPALLVSPVLEQGATTVKAYFPRATW